MAEVYDIYGTRVKEGNIIAYSSLSTDQLRIAVVVGVYDDEDYIKVVANDSKDYYKVKQKVIKVRVDNILKLHRNQIDKKVAEELTYIGSKYFDNNRRHADAVFQKGWTKTKPHNPTYYAVILDSLTGSNAYEPSTSLKEASESARMVQSVTDGTVVVCSYHNGEVARIYNLKRNIKQYNQTEVDLCKVAVDNFIKNGG